MVSGVRKKLKLRRPKRKRRTSAADPPPSFPPWTDLPGDVTANILQRLGPIEILESAQKVCTTWERVSQEPSLWRVIDMKPFRASGYMFCTEFYCRQAVDRSQGELIDINIEDYGTNELLSYISERGWENCFACDKEMIDKRIHCFLLKEKPCLRLYDGPVCKETLGYPTCSALYYSVPKQVGSSEGSSHLRSLRLACCPITSKGLTEAVKKFPELTELHLFHMQSILATADIETIGIYCPMLTSFTFNNRGLRFPLIDSDDNSALAVAKTMPNLRHLGLIGNRMRNKGLRAILDGCPHLESLDLRRCFYVDLTGDLGKRCSEQIKDLKRPSDSCSDYKWVSEISGGRDDFADYGSRESHDYDDDNYIIRNYDDPFNFEYLLNNSIH